MKTINKRQHLQDYADMLSIKDLCEFLSISATTAYQFIKNDKLTVIQVGREYKISRKSLAEFCNLKIGA